MKQDRKSYFTRFSREVVAWSGRSEVFSLALIFILAWLLAGPFMDFRESWQMLVHTVTAIITFLMVFLIQSEQNRNATALQIKLDELIASSRSSHDLAGLERLDESQLDDIRKQYLQDDGKEAGHGQQP